MTNKNAILEIQKKIDYAYNEIREYNERILFTANDIKLKLTDDRYKQYTYPNVFNTSGEYQTKALNVDMAIAKIEGLEIAKTILLEQTK